MRNQSTTGASVSRQGQEDSCLQVFPAPWPQHHHELVGRRLPGLGSEPTNEILRASLVFWLLANSHRTFQHPGFHREAGIKPEGGVPASRDKGNLAWERPQAPRSMKTTKEADCARAGKVKSRPSISGKRFHSLVCEQQFLIEAQKDDSNY